MRIENSFVPVRGVGEKTERRLWREGITHWDDFEPSSVGDVQGDNIIDYIDRARDRLAAGDTAFFDRAFPQAVAGGSTRTSVQTPAFSISKPPVWTLATTT